MGNDINATRANYSFSGLSQTRDVGYYSAGREAFRYAWKCLGVDRGLVPGGLFHRQPGGGSNRPHRARLGLSGVVLDPIRDLLRSAGEPQPPRPLQRHRLPYCLKFTGEHSVDLNASVKLDMLWVEPGTFTMGSPTTEAGRGTNETEHNVTLTQGFYLGKYEVTQAQYEAVMTGVTGDLNATPSNWHGNPNRPVEKVSWNDAQVFLSRLNAQQSANIPAGWAYVLPTESQWEYACRAGTKTMYSWGNDINSSAQLQLGRKLEYRKRL